MRHKAHFLFNNTPNLSIESQGPLHSYPIITRGLARQCDGDAMNVVPQNIDALLTRDQTAAALVTAGFPVKSKTLATKASRGGGPPYQLFGPRVLFIAGGMR